MHVSWGTHVLDALLLLLGLPTDSHRNSMRNETERVGPWAAQGSALVDLGVVLELVMDDLGVGHWCGHSRKALSADPGGIVQC